MGAKAETVISIRDLCVALGHQGFKGLTLDVKRGEILGVVGDGRRQNGADADHHRPIAPVERLA